MESTERRKNPGVREPEFLLLRAEVGLLLARMAGGLSLSWCGLWLCETSCLHRGGVFWWHQAVTSPDPQGTKRFAEEPVGGQTFPSSAGGWYRFGRIHREALPLLLWKEMLGKKVTECVNADGWK